MKQTKDLTIKELNIYVTDLLADLNDTNKVSLWTICRRLFLVKSTIRNETLEKDLVMDFYLEFEKALVAWNGETPFLLYIYNYIDKIQMDWYKYKTVKTYALQRKTEGFDLITSEYDERERGYPCELYEKFEVKDHQDYHINQAFSKLDGEEELIIKMHFGIGYDKPRTLNEIAEVFELTREGLRLRLKKILKKIKK